MNFFIGLGNPGSKYAHSRHNMGWQVLDKLVARAQALGIEDWKEEKPLEAETLLIGDSILVKPQTFMNLSGNAVRGVLKKYDYGSLSKKEFRALFVIYDDLDVETGKYKLVFGSGPKVHNGVNHIKETLGTDQFWHVRVGVDGRKGDRSVDSQDYVLSGFTNEEHVLIEKVVDSIIDVLTQKIEVST